jgi:hypothetical protein
MALPRASTADPPAATRLGHRRLRSFTLWIHDLWSSDVIILPLLIAVVVLIAVLSPIIGPSILPLGGQILPLLAGGMLLRVRTMRILIAVVVGSLAYDAMWFGTDVVRPGALGIIIVGAFFAEWLARVRQRIGVQGLRGEAMLIDLRDRLRAQGEMPTLPKGWQSETFLRSAGGASFGGDFFVSGLTTEGRFLEVVLVDVSGRGIDAGTRSLLLSGALGGLLGAVPASQFLSAANDYLLRQEWDDGFATAVHVAIDLDTGRFVVCSAGHLPAAQFSAGSGTWHFTAAEGMALGLFPKEHYEGYHGVLEPGDALLLYTDGLVEVPGRDLSVGVDKLIGEAERLVTHGFRNGARKLVTSVAPHVSDDRALLLIWRE